MNLRGVEERLRARRAGESAVGVERLL